MSKEIVIPGPPVGYTDLLDHAIIEKLQKEKAEYSLKKTRAYNPLRPSSAGACARKLAYELMEYKGLAENNAEVLTPNVYRLFQLGHSIEYSVLRMFSLVYLMRVDYKQQKLLCFELDATATNKEKELIIGSCDAVFINKEWRTIMDVKSVKDAFSKAFKTRWDETLAKYDDMKSLTKLSSTCYYADDVEAFLNELGEDFLRENILQLNSYAYADLMVKIGIDNCVIYKYNKNDSRHYELRFKPSLNLYNYVKDKLNAVNKAVAEGKPESVPKEYSLGSMHCAFCPYAKTCWPDQDEKKAWYNTFPKKNWPIDISKVKDEELVANFVAFEDNQAAEKKNVDVEKNIVTAMLKAEVKKIKLANGHIYELKHLKSPRPHIEVRRTKI